MKNTEIKYILNADQGIPYEIYNKKIKTRKNLTRLKKYLEVISTHNNNENIKKLLYELKDKGCTYAYVSNVVIEQFLKNNNYNYDEELFENTFGFDLRIDNEYIDLNILMVDIFTTLYNVVKLEAHKYDVYYFNSLQEAEQTLLNKSSATENESAVSLIEAGYRMEGITQEGKKIIKNSIPQNITVVGTHDEIAKELFGIEEKISDEKFKELFKMHNMTYTEYDSEVEAKLSGLLSSKMAFWMNYYFEKKNIDLEFTCKPLDNDYENLDDFVHYIENVQKKGYTISIDGGIMLYDMNFKKVGLTKDDKAGHMMTFKRFDSNNNIVVESWGREFIIKNDDIGNVFFQSSTINEKKQLSKAF